MRGDQLNAGANKDSHQLSRYNSPTSNIDLVVKHNGRLLMKRTSVPVDCRRGKNEAGCGWAGGRLGLECL